MGPPDCYRSFDRNVPEDDPAVCIARQKAEILSEEVDCMDLSCMTA